MNIWNYRYFNSVLVECGYDDQGKPDSYFKHLFLTDEYDKIVKVWTTEWQKEKEGYTIQPQEIIVIQEDGTETIEIAPSEPIIIPPEDVGTLDDYIKAKMAHDWKELTDAIVEAIWYEEQGFPSLADEFSKQIERRISINEFRNIED
ncbi:hypothetical protein C7H19_23750 [Aphanothece hegewaldii CCALA 016]|uniref:Uncharacterized protein n=1 Tax=Aphanothece hegewaldii CCALA 016 TaxID=2107694 RepID=A0A2T1LR21_9CHRO|nr:hypothetical protein [Aphanothece hegewaldii]PSF30529.1 hypothetical protein C7H19_23750 [Aphanothece hegewaldii CCALA 016]